MEEKVNSSVQTNSSDTSADRDSLLVFTVATIRCGIPARFVDHVVRMVAFTPIHDPPRGIVGIINYHGTILPVFSFRNFLSLNDKPPEINDYLIIIAGERNIAIIAESINGVYHPAEKPVPLDQISSGLCGISGVYRCHDGLVIFAHPKDLLECDDAAKIQDLKECLLS